MNIFFKIFFSAALPLTVLEGCSGDTECARSSGKKEFHSVIRGYADHYQNEGLSREFIDALKKYPDIADEVWFFCDNGWNPTTDSVNAAKFSPVAEEIRSLGIDVSIQDISTGHPDGQLSFTGLDIRGYRAAVGFDGSVLNSQTCPRDSVFRKALSKRYRTYCSAVKPRCVMVDDDLRISWHMPTNEICFCDFCIGEFNSRYGYNYTREELWKDMCANREGLRKQWIDFSQEGLGEVGALIADAVREVSPESVMGYQNVNFHNVLLEGYDWNYIFNTFAENSESRTIVSRPGHGYYYDQVPADLLSKAYGIARQIARLDGTLNPLYISPEIEGYRHKMTGKSAGNICLETLLYLSMGADAMSYALIGENNEPMDWYSDAYFDALQRHHKLFHDYVNCCGTSVGVGIDEYISPNQVFRDEEEGEKPGSFRETAAGSVCSTLGTLGIPFTPESQGVTATLLSTDAVKGMDFVRGNELDSLRGGVVMDYPAFQKAVSCGLKLMECADKEDVAFKKYQSENGKRVAVLRGSFSLDINGAERFGLIRAFDWASEGRMAAVSQSRHLGVIVPRGRADEDGYLLDGVTYINTTVTDEKNVVLRLRGVPEGARLRWESVDGSKKLHIRRSPEGDAIVTIPYIKTWSAGFISVCPKTDKTLLLQDSPGGFARHRSNRR